MWELGMFPICSIVLYTAAQGSGVLHWAQTPHREIERDHSDGNQVW